MTTPSLNWPISAKEKEEKKTNRFVLAGCIVKGPKRGNMKAHDQRTVVTGGYAGC